MRFATAGNYRNLPQTGGGMQEEPWSNKKENYLDFDIQPPATSYDQMTHDMRSTPPQLMPSQAQALPLVNGELSNSSPTLRITLGTTQ